MSIKSHEDLYHFVSIYMKEAQKICEPFLKQCELNYFWYSRFYPDGSFIDIGVHQEWFKYMIDNNYFGFNQELQAENWPPQEAVLISTPQTFNQYFSKNDIETITKKYNVFYNCNILSSQSEYLENFGFSASPTNHESLTLYSRYFGILKAFGAYFREKASDMVKQLEKELRGKIFFPILKDDENSIFTPIKRSNNFKDPNGWCESNLKHYFLSCPKGNVSISLRERQCLSLLCSNKCSKEIARMLNIDYRTVESFIANIKNKTGIRRRCELYKAMVNSGL